MKTTYELSEKELLIVRRALEHYAATTNDASTYKTQALEIRNKVGDWYIDALVSK